MRVLLAAALFLLLLPATATADEASVDAESCRWATPGEPFVFQVGCWYGGHYCITWTSEWDHQQGHARSTCAVW